MNILVPIKRVVDYNVRIRVKSDGSGVETDGVKMSINPFDEIAIEEALRLKEAGHAEAVILVSVGNSDAQQQLRTGLAMGADRAIHIHTEDAMQPLSVAQALLKTIEKEQPGIVIMGKQAIDGDNNQTPQMLAALWQRPQATFASKIELNDGTARVTREVDAGLETLDIDLPAVLSCDLRLNEPRFVKLPDIMKAKRKPLELIDAAEYGLDTSADLQMTHFAPPPKRERGEMVESVQALVDALKTKGLL
ncbi:MAG: electron transfer flavoprotein subunit beta/FixA family protein [Pseudomonadota bacterium]